MGGTSTKVLKKVASPVTNAASYLWGSSPAGMAPSASCGELACYQLPPGASVFVMHRSGSMYFDEDGDLAHEFYEEQYNSHRQKMIMKRKRRNLRPQGEVKHLIPRINNNLPFILCEAPS